MQKKTKTKTKTHKLTYTHVRTHLHNTCPKEGTSLDNILFLESKSLDIHLTMYAIMINITQHSPFFACKITKNLHDCRAVL